VEAKEARGELPLAMALVAAPLVMSERGIPEAPGRPLSLAFTSRSVNLSWAPPFNADQVRISHYLVQVRAGEETSWKEGSYTVETPDNVTLFQVSGLNPFTTYSFRVTAVTAARAKKSKPSESSFYMFTLREGWYISFFFYMIFLFLNSCCIIKLSILQGKQKFNIEP